MVSTPRAGSPPGAADTGPGALPTAWPDPADRDRQGDPGYWRFFDALLTRRLQLGETTTQDNLCVLLGMSISPLRETITLLQAEGLVSVRKRVGVTVFLPDVAFVRSSFQFRGLIEREGLRKLCARPPLTWIDRMVARQHAAIDAVRVATSPDDYEALLKSVEQDLHGRFAAAFDNWHIADTHARLMRKLYLLRLVHPSGVNTRNTLASLEDHLEILRALKNVDAERCVACLDTHMAGVIHRTLAL